MQQQQQQQEAFVEQLKKLFSKTGIVANRPRGRPRKTGVSKEQVKPSKVPKKERLRAKKSKMDASRYAKDLLTFRERPPTKKEFQLMPEYALPSKLAPSGEDPERVDWTIGQYLMRIKELLEKQR
jgi:hypothetical protein